MKRFRELGARIVDFFLVGGLVFAAGVSALYVLIERLHFDESYTYFVVGVFSILSNFLLNRGITWKDRMIPGSFWFHVRRFLAAKLISFLLNQLVYNIVLMTVFSWYVPPWVWGTLVATCFSTLVTLVGFEKFVFITRSDRSEEPEEVTGISSQLKLSVIIPAFNEPGMIVNCLETILAQTYRPHEIIVVTGQDDPTLAVIGKYIAQGDVRVVYYTRPRDMIGRDTNARRKLGCQEAKGDVLVFADSKCQVPADWLDKMVNLFDQGELIVAGITRHMPGDKRFRAALADGGLFSENVRHRFTYLHLDNYDKVTGLPVTACLAFRKSVFERIKDEFPVVPFSGWEDFALVSVMIQAGIAIRTTNQIWTYRTHQPKFRIAKHFVTGMAARKFLLRNPENAFARRRHRDAMVVSSMMICTVVVLILVTAVLGWQTGIGLSMFFAAVVLALLGVLNVLKAGSVQAFLFPPVIMFQVTIWLLGYWIAAARRGEIPRWLSELMGNLRILLIIIFGGST